MNYFERLKRESALESEGQENRRSGRRPQRRVVRDVLPPAAREPRPARPLPSQLAEKRRALSSPLPEAAAPTPAPALPVAKPPAELPSPQEKTPSLPTRPPASTVIEQPLPVHTWEPDTVRLRRRRLTIFGWTAVVLVAAGFAVPTFAFPKFSVTIYPEVKILAVERTELSATTAITTPDLAAKKIPGIIIGVDKTLTQDYPANGKKFISEQAGGTVRLFNAFSSSPQTLVANTRLQDPAGNIFRLKTGIAIPGAEILEGKIVPTSTVADVIADGPGERYNIGPTEFRIPGFRGTPKYQGFYATSEAAFSGGFEGETKIVLAEDLKQASEDLTRRVIQELQTDLQKKIPAGEDFLVPAGARETAILNIATPKVGERFKRFSVTASGRGRLFAVRRSHLFEILAAPLPKVPEFATKFSNTQSNLEAGQAKFSGADELRFMASGSLAYYAGLDIEKIEKTLRSATPAKAEVYLKSHEEIQSFRVKRFPRWLWFIPQRASGLEVSMADPD